MQKKNYSFGGLNEVEVFDEEISQLEVYAINADDFSPNDGVDPCGGMIPCGGGPVLT